MCGTKTISLMYVHASQTQIFRSGFSSANTASPKNVKTKPSSAKLSYLNFHPLEVVSRYRDPQKWVKITHTCLI